MTLKTLLCTAALMALPLAAQADAPKAFDVAEDITRFTFAAAPVFDDGMPAYGNAFVTQGYIYPAGTLSDGAEGVNPDGSPAYPDLVIGTWTCDGYFVGDGMRTETGAIVITRQVHQFDTGEILVSHGPRNRGCRRSLRARGDRRHRQSDGHSRVATSHARYERRLWRAPAVRARWGRPCLQWKLNLTCPGPTGACPAIQGSQA